MSEQFAKIRSALERTRATSCWPKQAVDELCVGAEIRTYRDGERAMSAGDFVDAVWIVTDGAFLLSKLWKSGRRLVYSYLQPGQLTGVLPVFDGQPAAFDVTARGSATALIVQGSAIREIARAYPDVAFEIIGYLCRRTRVDYEALELYSMNSVRCRVAKVILWIARGQPRSADAEIVVDSKVSQEDLADIVSAARQSVTRELQRLIRDGILKQRYRTIVISDWDRLVRVAGEEEELSPVAHARLAPVSNHFFETTD